MDAEKLPKALNADTILNAAAVPPTSCREDCVPAHCHPGCSLEAIAQLLTPPSDITGEEADSLLDLHHLLKGRRDAEGALRLFCDIRWRLEHRHYLLLYRLRRWLENQVLAEVHPNNSATPVLVPLRLSFYCVEPLRRQCLCACLRYGADFQSPRIRFIFRPLANPPPPAST